MTETVKSDGEARWICNLCEIPLEVQTVRLQYLGTIFAIHLPACPGCGMILIDEELATGRMVEAEAALEDK